MDNLLQWNSAPFTAGDAIPLSIQIKGAGLVIRAFLSRFEIPRPRPSSICCAVVQRNLQEQSVRIGSRQLQRFSEPWRLQYKAVRKYGRRYETAPGDHMQIDFCEKTIMGNNEAVKIHVFVAALVFSRRIFAKAYPAKNQTAWLDGIKSAFFSSRRVRERLSATTPDVWFASTTAAAQPNGRKPIACASYHP